MDILKNLEAQRQLVLNTMFTENTAYATYLLKRYERDCRKAGINPDTWEGLR